MPQKSRNLVCVPDSSSGFVSSPDERRSPFLAPLAAGAKPLLLQAADGASQVPLLVPHLPAHTAPPRCPVPLWGALSALPSWEAPVPVGSASPSPEAPHMLLLCCALHTVLQTPGTLRPTSSFSSGTPAYHTCSKVDLNCSFTVDIIFVRRKYSPLPSKETAAYKLFNIVCGYIMVDYY